MPGIDFKKIGKYLTKNDLWEKPLSEFDHAEITGLCETILEATAPEDGFVLPWLSPDGVLTIPYRAPAKYRYWKGGQSLLETLVELGASDDIKAKYMQTGHGEGLPKDRGTKAN